MNHEPIPRVIGGLLRVLQGEGAAKHGDDWRIRADREDDAHAAAHEFAAEDPHLSDFDGEGDLHELKRLCRLALKLERRMIRDEGPGAAHSGDSSGFPG